MLLVCYMKPNHMHVHVHVCIQLTCDLYVAVVVQRNKYGRLPH